MNKQLKRYAEIKMELLPFVQFDRFVEDGQYITAYGWIEREEDEYKDFVLIDFQWTKKGAELHWWTSSDKYSEKIHELLGGKEQHHNRCKRVEEHFNIPNCIRLRSRSGSDE